MAFTQGQVPFFPYRYRNCIVCAYLPFVGQQDFVSSEVTRCDCFYDNEIPSSRPYKIPRTPFVAANYTPDREHNAKHPFQGNAYSLHRHRSGASHTVDAIEVPSFDYQDTLYPQIYLSDTDVWGEDASWAVGNSDTTVPHSLTIVTMDSTVYIKVK